MSTEEQAVRISQLEGSLAVKTQRLSTAEEALGVIATSVGESLKIPTSEFRNAARGSELASLVVRALARNAAAPATGAAPSNGDTAQAKMDALSAASIASLKARIGALEARLLEEGIDPITVRGDEPEGFRDDDASKGGKTVAGAADDLTAAFASSNEIEPDRS